MKATELLQEMMESKVREKAAHKLNWYGEHAKEQQAKFDSQIAALISGRDALVAQEKVQGEENALVAAERERDAARKEAGKYREMLKEAEPWVPETRLETVPLIGSNEFGYETRPHPLKVKINAALAAPPADMIYTSPRTEAARESMYAALLRERTAHPEPKREEEDGRTPRWPLDWNS